MPTFGEVLKAAREAAKLTQHQVAAKAGLSQAAISKAELAASADDAGRKETLEKIATATGTTLETLIRDMSPSRQTGLGVRDVPPAEAADPAQAALAGSSPNVPRAVPRETIDERARRISVDMLNRGWADTELLKNSEIMSYFGDVIGRNFDHKRHKIVDSHELLGLYENYLESLGPVLCLPPHFSQEFDIGIRVMLDAMALLRSHQDSRDFANLALAMAVCAGREVRRAHSNPEDYPMPPVVFFNTDDIPF